MTGKRNRKHGAFGYCVFIIVFMGINIAVTAAILSSLYKSRQNNFAPAGAKIVIQENDEEPAQTSENELSVVTDDEGRYMAEKKVQITSVQNDEYIKAALVPQWYDSEGRLCAGLGNAGDFGTAQPPDPLTNTQRHISTQNELVTILTYHLSPDWQKYWNYDISTGFYTYRTPLKKGETTQPLILFAELSPETYALCKDYTLHIDVIVESSQVR